MATQHSNTTPRSTVQQERVGSAGETTVHTTGVTPEMDHPTQAMDHSTQNMDRPTPDTARHAQNRTRAADKTWKTWPDWVNVALGVVLALTPLVATGAPAGWFVTLGLIAVVVGLWALASASSKASEWTQIIVGAVVFLAPWLGGFAAITGAAWTAWIIGVALIVFAALGMNQGNKYLR